MARCIARGVRAATGWARIGGGESAKLGRMVMPAFQLTLSPYMAPWGQSLGLRVRSANIQIANKLRSMCLASTRCALL